MLDAVFERMTKTFRVGDPVEAPRLEILEGVAGGGKSAFSHSLAKRCYDKGCLGSSFFFNREHPQRSKLVIFPALPTRRPIARSPDGRRAWRHGFDREATSRRRAQRALRTCLVSIPVVCEHWLRLLPLEEEGQQEVLIRDRHQAEPSRAVRQTSRTTFVSPSWVIQPWMVITSSSRGSMTTITELTLVWTALISTPLVTPRLAQALA